MKIVALSCRVSVLHDLYKNPFNTKSCIQSSLVKTSNTVKQNENNMFVKFSFVISVVWVIFGTNMERPPLGRQKSRRQ